MNHPGGYCWGAGTNLKVTPYIKPGDRVSIRFGTAANADADDSTTVADAFVNAGSVLDEATRTLTVTGVFNGGLNPAQVEQRIVNPELTTTDVARRDVRAVPGGLVAAPKGGYSSNLEVTGNTFKATYVFTTLETARIATVRGVALGRSPSHLLGGVYRSTSMCAGPTGCAAADRVCDGSVEVATRRIGQAGGAGGQGRYGRPRSSTSSGWRSAPGSVRGSSR